MRFAPGSNKPALFVRSLKENPELVEMVHVMGVGWRAGDRDLNHEVNDFLRDLPSLRGLQIWAELDEEHFVPHFLETNPMRHLTSMRLNDKQLTIDIIKKCLFLKHLQYLTLVCKFPGTYSPLISAEKKTSQLLSLVLEEDSHIPPEILRGVLRICPEIKTLQCALPGRSVPNQFVWFDSTKLASIFSPVLISNALATAQNTLQKLELHICLCEWPGHDDSRVNLNMVKALRHVDCLVKCFFISGALCKTRVGLYKLLPASLEELHLRFEYTCSLECRDNPINDNQSPIQKPDSEFLWLLKIANKKAEYGSCIERIRLERYDLPQDCGTVDDDLDDIIQLVSWDPPLIVAKSLSEARTFCTGKVFRSQI
ncbi:hypothetical protein G7Y89_g4558 [Cudoniella acicularis]|uniref:FBD domain-containing protein n=1 Tax=Cudoniella acicularis TaxID=354080 RepID=A0A8H4RP77_9HELO|nr:hypothetical protein G7Y89_g4558 [Cudoniella acicularis]